MVVNLGGVEMGFEFSDISSPLKFLPADLNERPGHLHVTLCHSGLVIKISSLLFSPVLS